MAGDGMGSSLGPDEVRLRMPSDPDHPVQVAMRIASALRDGLAWLHEDDMTGRAITEARNYDFASMLDRVGISTVAANPMNAEGDPIRDVAYVRLIPGVRFARSVRVSGLEVLEGYTITLVYRADPGRWLVHSIGDPVAPEDMSDVRTNPGLGPDL